MLPQHLMPSRLSSSHTFSARASSGWAQVIWITVVLAIAALFVALPRRAVWLLPALTLSFLIGSSAVAATDVHPSGT